MERRPGEDRGVGARAALDALSEVDARRDAVLDRRRLGRLFLIEAFVVVAVFGCWLVAQRAVAGRAPGPSLTALPIVVLALQWDQLTRGLRERTRARIGLRGSARAVHLGLTVTGVLAFLVSSFLVVARHEVPVPLIALGVLLTLAGGTWGWAVLRGPARGRAVVPAAQHLEMTVVGRVATGLFGLGLGLIAAAAPWLLAGGVYAALAVVATVISLAIAVVGRFSRAVAELGAVWSAPQWTAFGISGAIICGGLILAGFRPALGAVTGVVSAIAVLVVFAVAACWHGRGDG
ncbi:hypothetical protein [uncultured Microbacterium sp.]|uniref:hypothetical protein n=1 Tax=uncultured Microbacterium sp. TaxID=191216 RepID=UPI0025E5925C|nr:hypothetical protein [uncultured Microbacterium sp.]